MGNAKGKQNKSDGNKIQRARVEFLHRAAKFLHSQAQINRTAPDSDEVDINVDKMEVKNAQDEESAVQQRSGDSQGSARFLTRQMRATARKSQLRLARETKRALCRRCDAVLETAEDYTEVIDNKSRGGKKAWADVRVVTCTACGGMKRFPIGAKQQTKKSKRTIKVTDVENDINAPSTS